MTRTIIEKIKDLRDQALNLEKVGLDSKFYQGRADGLDEALSILLKTESKQTTKEAISETK